VQENIIRGGYVQLDVNGHRRRARGIKSIDRDQKLNSALWTLAEKMSALKTAQ
jgi:hypothetical protein